MATAPAPAPSASPETPSVNHLGRLLGALFNPKATFEEIARRPSWVVPIVVLTVISLGVSIMMGQKVNWERVVAQQVDESPQAAQMSPEQREQQVAIGAKVARVMVYVFGTLGTTIFALILAGLFFGLFNWIAEAGVRFVTAMGIAAHSMVPAAISGVLGIVILAVKDPDTIDPQNLLASHLGTLLSGDSPKWLQKLAESFDLFSFWIMILLALGFTAANPKKVAFGKAVGIVFGVWAAYVLVKVGWTALRS